MVSSTILPSLGVTHTVPQSHTGTYTHSYSVTPSLTFFPCSFQKSLGHSVNPRSASGPRRGGRELGEVGGRGPTFAPPPARAQRRGTASTHAPPIWQDRATPPSLSDRRRGRCWAAWRGLPPTVPPTAFILARGVAGLARRQAEAWPSVPAPPRPSLQRRTERAAQQPFGSRASCNSVASHPHDSAEWPSRRLPSSAPRAGPGSPPWRRRCKQA